MARLRLPLLMPVSSSRRLARRVAALLCLGLGVLGVAQWQACGGARDPDAPPVNTDDGTPQLVSLRISPENDVVQIDLNTEVTKAFTVKGLYSDGRSADFTRKVKWTLEKNEMGRFNSNTFRSATQSKNAVGFTKVYAKIQDGDRLVTGLANLTLVWLRQSGESQDFFFNLPHKAPAQKKPLVFSTQVQSLDVFFAMDTTGSMGAEIQQLSRSLQNTIIPGVKAAAAKDAWFGVGAVDDWPVSPHGSANCSGGPDDQPFILLQSMTDDVKLAQTGVGQLLRGSSPRGCGADLPEGQLEALYLIATGDAQTGGGANVPANHKGIGGVEFRDGALPTVVMISDAAFHTKNEGGNCQGSAMDLVASVSSAAHDRKQTEDALNKICAKVIGLSAIQTYPEECMATRDMIKFAKATGALVPPEAWDAPMRPNNCQKGKCCTGLSGAGEAPDANGLCPLVFKIGADGTGVDSQVTGGISQLARYASFDVVTNVIGKPGNDMGVMLPAGKTTADFLKSIVPLDALPPPPPPIIPTPIITDKGFSKVVPGSYVRFNIEAMNDFQPEQSQPQVFHATIRIRAGGCANLDERDVIILIPPSAPVLG